MKKIFTLIALAATSLSMMAKDYTCPLTVNVSGTEMPCGDTQVGVTKQDNGKYTLSLENFSLMGMINVGSIVVKDVDAIDYNNGLTVINTQQTIQIAAGTTAGVDPTTWLGPTLGDVPILLKGELKGDKFNAVLNINMSKLGGMNVGVQLGDITEMDQLPNSGFENYHKASVSLEGGEPATSDEPNGWHSFMSASGDPTLVYLAGYAPHTFISDDVREFATTNSKHSLKITAADMWVAIANGTVTTGRMNTGTATEPTNTDLNYAWTDWTSTDVDANGDPFYAPLTGKPDALSVWLKYGQGDPNGPKAKDHPYATVTAIITDGTEYHEPVPSNTKYTNIVAEARNNKITSTNGEWKNFLIPFDYKSFEANKANPRTILATISTNADAAMGSDGDSILVDDIRLIYYNSLTGLSYKGHNYVIDGNDVKEWDSDKDYIEIAGPVSANDFETITDGKGAYVSITLVPDMDANGQPLNNGITNGYITVTSNDLKEAEVYNMTIKDPTATGITKPQSITKPAGVKAIYNMAGQQVQSMQKGNVYIVKYNNGETKKIIKK